MASPPVLSDLGRKDSAPPASKDGSGLIPSGFILKLYQMVNGAPDEVISWTPSGDAFRIGEDLNRLESETLPHYFRHSRFQSLVRQLNFYNFRKVNRERTFWIYKHSLFHRDRPQDLHLLRRRTCPGVDGRKNRFSSGGSRRSASKAAVVESSERRETLASNNSRVNSREQSGNDDSSFDGTSDDDSRRKARSLRKKRNYAPFGSADAKRLRRDLQGLRAGRHLDKHTDDSVVVDLSLVSSGSSGSLNGQASMHHRETRPAKDEDDDDTSMAEKDERSEMIEQSLVVSQVAMKLEEYAKRAKKGLSKTRRGGTHGVVTPPHPRGQLATEYSAGYGLLTYDDEYESESDFSPYKSSRHTEQPSPSDRIRRRESTNTVVTDGDDSLTSEDDVCARPLKCVSEASSPAHKAPKSLGSASPVADAEVAKAVTRRLLAGATSETRRSMVVTSVIASFCMSTPATVCTELGSQIYELILSCEPLAFEFQQYRAALHPLECVVDLHPSCTFVSTSQRLQNVSMQHIWESEAFRFDAIRDFKTFAVNCINWVLDQTPESAVNLILSEKERLALRHTANVWLTSASD